MRVRHPVDLDLEMTAIGDRTLRRGGPPVLFERIAGDDTPVRGNLFGTTRRLARAMGADDMEAAREIGRLLGFFKAPPRGCARLGRASLFSRKYSTCSLGVCRGALLGAGPGGRRGRPIAPAHRDLLARRCGAADHLGTCPRILCRSECLAQLANRLGASLRLAFGQSPSAREWGRAIAMDPAVKPRVDAMWGELGIA